MESKHILWDGTETIVTPKNGKTWEYEELTAFVGGYIEIIEAEQKGYVLVLNENGLGDGLPINPKAKQLAHPRFRWPDVPMVGNVLLTPSKTIK